MHVHGTRQAGFLTKLPNATARDHALSFTARGLLAYMLTLPDGAREDVKTLANKSVEGRSAVSRALHELESRGYLARTKSRDDDGRIRTNVEVYADRDGATAQVGPEAGAPGTGAPGGGKSGSKTEESGFKDSLPPPPPLLTEPRQEVDGEPGGRAGCEPSKAESLLVRIGRDDPRPHLAAAEAAALAPLVETWLERGATPEHLVSVLTSGLPGRVHQPLALVRHRLTAKMPPERPVRPRPPQRHECADCGVPVRRAGRCRECADPDTAAALSPLATVGRAGADLVRAQLRRHASASAFA